MRNSSSWRRSAAPAPSDRRRRGRIAAVVVAATLLPAATPEPSQLLQRAAAAATEAGCGEVATTPDYDPADRDRAHIAPTAGPPLSTYPTTPPASGPHADIPRDRSRPASTTSPSRRSTARSTRWSTARASSGTTRRRRSARSPGYGSSTTAASRTHRSGKDRAIVAPYDIPGDAAGILPEGTEMALVSWHRLRSCASIDLAVAFDFTSQYSFPTAEDRSTRASRPNPGPRSGDRGDRWPRRRSDRGIQPRNARRLREEAPTSSGATRRKPGGSARRSAAARGARRRSVARSPRRGSRSPPSRRSRCSAASKGRTRSRRARSKPRARPAARSPSTGPT